MKSIFHTGCCNCRGSGLEPDVAEISQLTGELDPIPCKRCEGTGKNEITETEYSSSGMFLGINIIKLPCECDE